MVYKVGSPEDIVNIPNINEAETKVITKFARILSDMYGSDRDIDNDYGGYILFATKGTNPEEIKNVFDYEENLLEYAELHKGDICAAVYITSTEYGVVLIMSMNDAPKIIREHVKDYFLLYGNDDVISVKVRTAGKLKDGLIE